MQWGLSVLVKQVQVVVNREWGFSELRQLRVHAWQYWVRAEKYFAYAIRISTNETNMASERRKGSQYCHYEKGIGWIELQGQCLLD